MPTQPRSFPRSGTPIHTVAYTQPWDHRLRLAPQLLNSISPHAFSNSFLFLPFSFPPSPGCCSHINESSTDTPTDFAQSDSILYLIVNISTPSRRRAPARPTNRVRGRSETALPSSKLEDHFCISGITTQYILSTYKKLVLWLACARPLEGSLPNQKQDPTIRSRGFIPDPLGGNLHKGEISMSQ